MECSLYEEKQAKDRNAFKNKLNSHNKLINDFKFTKGNITILNKKVRLLLLLSCFFLFL